MGNQKMDNPEILAIVGTQDGGKDKQNKKYTVLGTHTNTNNVNKTRIRRYSLLIYYQSRDLATCIHLKGEHCFPFFHNVNVQAKIKQS